MFWEAHNYYLISLYPLLNVLHLDERGMAHELPPCHIVGVNFF